MTVSLAGKRLGDYEIRACLEEDHRSCVYDAFDHAEDRPLSVRVWPNLALDNEQIRTEFEALSQALIKLDHPNILTIYDAGINDEHHIAYAVLPHLGAEPLEKHLQQTWPVEDAVRVAAEVVRALGAAHEQGLVHGDVRPCNVVLTEGGWPLVTNFGLSNFFPVSDDAEAWSYWSPERLEGAAASPTSDLYAAAILLYEMLSGGEHPFPATHKEDLVALQQEGPSRLRKRRGDLPRPVDDVLRQALVFDPGTRFGSASDLAMALIEALPADKAYVEGRAHPRTPPSGIRGRAPEPLETGVDATTPKTWHKVGRFLWSATKWLLGKLAAAVVVLVLILGALTVGSAFLLSDMLERRLAVQEWRFYGWEEGGESYVLEKHLEQPLREAIEPYALGSVSNLHADFRPPDNVIVEGLLQGRSVALQLGIRSEQGVPQIQLERLNGVPLYIVGGILSEGINNGLRQSWTDVPLHITRLHVDNEEIWVTLTPVSTD